MRYIRAFYSVETISSGKLSALPALHTEYDDQVFALPYHRTWDDEEDNFAVAVIFKNGAINEAGVHAYLDKSLALWGIENAHLSTMDDCTLEDCFMDSVYMRFRSGNFDEDQIKRMLNLNATCSFIGANSYGMRDVVVEWSLERGKALELAAATDYKEALQAEIEAACKPAWAEAAEGSMAAPQLPITYIVEGNAVSDADGAINILVGSLRANGRISSGHVFTIDVDSHDRWIRRDQDGNYRYFINPQLIRAIEGNTLVIRYGAFDSANSFDVESYALLCSLLDLLEDAAASTQLILSVPEGNPDLVARLRRRHNKPIVLIAKDSGTSLSDSSFERNLEQMESMASARGIEPDESMGVLLSKRMRSSNALELEQVFNEWSSYHEARIAYPQYAAIIDEAINLGISDEEASAQSKLEGLIGLGHVKEHIRNIIMRIEMNQQLLEKGLPMQRFSMHMAFVGAPGTGKTEVARLYAEILKDKGILSEGRLITVSGGSKFNIKDTFEKAKGSVLFIDEAYGLLGFSDMITELIAQMENNRNDTVVILAGYEGHMDALISSNPGFRSRIGFTIKFPDYSADELKSIFSYMCSKQELVMGDGVDEAVRDILERGGKRADHGNARFVRKLFEDAVGEQQIRLAKRMKADPEQDMTLDDLRTLTVSDIERATSSLGLGNREGKNGRQELKALIGLDSIKDVIAARMDFAKMQKVKRNAGLKAPFIPMHMAFKGNPGTGKTEVARLIGRILREEGVLSMGNFYECGRQDLVSPAVGGSAPKVEALFEEARGSVIFIDEAYSLIDGAKDGPGDEAITAIIDQMEKLREEVVVIFAGYTKEIEDLLSTNPGFQSRVKTQIEFPDYTPDELVQILHHMADKQGYVLAEGIDAKVDDAVARASRSSEFGNARFVRNLLEDALVNQSVRLASDMRTEDADGKECGNAPHAAGKEFSEDEIAALSTLLPEDFAWKADVVLPPSIGFAA